MEVEDCRKLFKAAYDNRYTWGHDFSGYKGTCTWSDGERLIKGSINLGKDLKANVKEISDKNNIASALLLT